MSNLHNEIMNIPCPKSHTKDSLSLVIAYKEGHRDARHSAAKLATDADAVIDELKKETDALKAQIDGGIRVNANISHQIRGFVSARNFNLIGEETNEVNFMNAADFKELSEKVTCELHGKTISHATYADWGMGYSITLHFTDGTSSEITPEHDEGFMFSAPVKPT